MIEVSRPPEYARTAFLIFDKDIMIPFLTRYSAWANSGLNPISLKKNKNRQTHSLSGGQAATRGKERQPENLNRQTRIWRGRRKRRQACKSLDMLAAEYDK